MTLRKNILLFGKLLGKINKPEFFKVEVEYEGVDITWSGFVSAPLDELLRKFAYCSKKHDALTDPR